jgi:hypothetical protein
MTLTDEIKAKSFANELNSNTDTRQSNEIYVSGEINEDATDGTFSVRLNEITNRVSNLNYMQMANLVKLLNIKMPEQAQPVIHWPGIGNIRYCHIADEVRSIAYFQKIARRKNK